MKVYNILQKPWDLKFYFTKKKEKKKTKDSTNINIYRNKNWVKVGKFELSDFKIIMKS